MVFLNAPFILERSPCCSSHESPSAEIDTGLEEKRCTPRTARRRLRLLKFEFQITPWPGVYHKAPDAMSGLSRNLDEEAPDPDDADIPTLNVLNIDKSNEV